MIHLYYFSPFDFRFRSGAMIQETRNFTHLARLGYRVFFYGTYRDEAGLKEIRDYIGEAPITLYAKRAKGKREGIGQLEFMTRIARDRTPGKIVIGRHVRWTNVLLRFRRMLGNPTLLHELHERAFPYLVTEDAGEKAELKRLTDRVMGGVDGLFLTNYSQEIILKQEYPNPPSYGIFPHAVEFEKFAGAKSNLNFEGETPRGTPYVVTFLGHFAAWRNFEILFQVLAALSPRYVLRIAGGISSKAEDTESRVYLEGLTKKYELEGRVTYLGHVAPGRVKADVLTGSSVLVMPMGDNLSARYFTCPIKLLEYMSTEIPVVAVDYPSVSLITGGDSVFLTGEDCDSFRQAIEHAVSAPDRVARIQRMNEIARKGSFEERSRRVDAWYRERLAAHAALGTAAREPA